MEPTLLKALLDRQKALDDFLRTHDELSLAIDAELNFKRMFVIACGSYCEEQMTLVLERFVARHGDERLTLFVRNRLLTRKFHDLFEWDRPQANAFFAFFGTECKKDAQDRIGSEPGLGVCVKAFLELGSLRNAVAHKIDTAPIDKTLAELEEMLTSAIEFMKFVEAFLAPRGENQVS